MNCHLCLGKDSLNPSLRSLATAGRPASPSRAFYEAGLAITGRAFAAGVKVLVGADAGDSFVFPGSSVHDEMAELVKVGLTPAQAPATATVRSAEFLGLGSEYGTVAAGRRTDLVLLAGNPLTDIGNTRRIDAVLFGGRVLPRCALDDCWRKSPASSPASRSARREGGRPQATHGPGGAVKARLHGWR